MRLPGEKIDNDEMQWWFDQAKSQSVRFLLRVGEGGSANQRRHR
jgi:hypothetical protein